MTVRITGTAFKDITPDIQKALDTALTGTLNLQQAALNKANPVDTGRMASSWRIGGGTRPDADRGEDWESDVGVKWDYESKITFKGNWFLSNETPYSVFIAYNYPPSATKAQKDWFTAIANQTGNVFTRQFNKVKP